MRYLVLGVMVIILIGSCKKEEPVEIKTLEEPVEEVAQKRILIEAFTNVTCGACPLAHHAIEEIESENEDVFHITHYLRGPMNHPYTQYVRDNVKAVSFTPQAIIQRFSDNGGVQHFGPEEYASIAEQELSMEPELDLKVTANINGAELSLTSRMEYIGSKDVDELRLTAMIVDKVVVGDDFDYHQRNYGNEDPNHPYFGEGDYIIGFEHTNVLHSVITPLQGEMVVLVDNQANLDLETNLDGLNIEEYAVIVMVSHTHKQDILNAFYLDLADL